MGLSLDPRADPGLSLLYLVYASPLGHLSFTKCIRELHGITSPVGFKGSVSCSHSMHLMASMGSRGWNDLHCAEGGWGDAERNVAGPGSHDW